MKAFLYGIALQWKIDIRRKDVLLMYYLMPLIFFLFIGGIFTSISSEMSRTLIYAMTVFSICAGAFIGAPTSIMSFYGTDLKKAYRAGGVPLWSGVINTFLSAFLHLLIVVLIIVCLSPLLFGANSPDDFLSYGGITLLFLATALSLGIFLGLLLKNPAKLSIVTLLLFLFSIMLSGIMLPDDFLPDTLQTIGGFLPLRWAFCAFTGQAVMQNILLMAGTFVMGITCCGIRLTYIERSEA